VELRPRISQNLVEIHFREGQRVAAGAPLFTLDRTRLEKELAAREAELAAARLDRDQARRRHERFAGLPEGAVSRDERDRVETAFALARAQVERLAAEVARVEERLAESRITAPFAGVLSESRVDRGDFLKEGDHLATIYRVDELEAVFHVTERQASRVALDQEVVLRTDARPDRTFTGRVIFVSPALEESTRDLLVKASVANGEGLLRPGLFVAAEVVVERRQDRPVVAESALVATRKGYLLYVVDEEGKARRREVETGLRKPGVVEILEGVQEGERVVVAGTMNLSEGAPVSIAEEGGEEEEGGRE
jgi:membrane fusion protein (multidrug efflux system)